MGFNPHLKHYVMKRVRPSGFTLMEIMIVVVIVGLLAVLALPAFKKARINAQASVIVNNFRSFSGSFQTYNLDTGEWPAEHMVAGAVPPGMEGTLKASDWIEGCPINGYYAFENPDDGNSVAVLLVANDMNIALQTRVDTLMDDGDLATGLIRGDNQSLDYYLEADLLP